MLYSFIVYFIFHLFYYCMFLLHTCNMHIQRKWENERPETESIDNNICIINAIYLSSLPILFFINFFYFVVVGFFVHLNVIMRVLKQSLFTKHTKCCSNIWIWFFFFFFFLFEETFIENDYVLHFWVNFILSFDQVNFIEKK